MESVAPIFVLEVLEGIVVVSCINRIVMRMESVAVIDVNSLIPSAHAVISNRINP
jgi:hypothetical protein